MITPKPFARIENGTIGQKTVFIARLAPVNQQAVLTNPTKGFMLGKHLFPDQHA